MPFCDEIVELLDKYGEHIFVTDESKESEEEKMNARKCDRCGKFYEVNENKKEREYGVVRKIKIDTGFATKTKNCSLDLCEPCYKEFLAYVKPKKEK